MTGHGLEAQNYVTILKTMEDCCFAPSGVDTCARRTNDLVEEEKEVGEFAGGKEGRLRYLHLVQSCRLSMVARHL